MFGNLGLHVIHNPAGTFSYVGSIPVTLARIVPATKSDVMGGRAFKNERGELSAYKFPCFESRELAIRFAESHGHAVIAD